MASGTRSVSGGSVGLGRAGWFVGVVVLLTLFGGLFALSAQADSHTANITVDCDSYEIELSGYSDGSTISYFVSSGGQISELFDTESFDGSFSASGSLDPTLEQSVSINVSDPVVPSREISRGWASPVCPTTTTGTSPTTAAPGTTAGSGTTAAPGTTAGPGTTADPAVTTTAVTVAPSTLPFTGAESVSSALLAVVLFGSGALALLFARRAED